MMMVMLSKQSSIVTCLVAKKMGKRKSFLLGTRLLSVKKNRSFPNLIWILTLLLSTDKVAQKIARWQHLLSSPNRDKALSWPVLSYLKSTTYLCTVFVLVCLRALLSLPRIIFHPLSFEPWKTFSF
jgi:hypothetical protein